MKPISKCKRRIGAPIQVLLTLLPLTVLPSALPAQTPIGGIEGRVTAENVATNAQATQTGACTHCRVGDRLAASHCRIVNF